MDFQAEYRSKLRTPAEAGGGGSKNLKKLKLWHYPRIYPCTGTLTGC